MDLSIQNMLAESRLLLTDVNIEILVDHTNLTVKHIIFRGKHLPSNFLEQYTEINNSKQLIRTWDSEFTLIQIEHCDFHLYGGVLRSRQNMNLLVKDSFFNQDMNSFGLELAYLECNHPEAQLTGFIRIENN